MDINNLSLIELMPSILKRDEFANALCDAIEPILKELNEEVENVLIYGRIDFLSESDIDKLIDQFSIDYYQNNLSLDQKKKMVKTALKFHIIKGTVGAIEDYGDIIFESKTEVETWFDFNRDPYTFRIVVDLCSLMGFDDFCNGVDKVKAKRSHLEGVTGKIDHGIEIENDIEYCHSNLKFCNTFNAGQWPFDTVEGIIIDSRICSENYVADAKTKLNLVNTFKAGE